MRYFELVAVDDPHIVWVPSKKSWYHTDVVEREKIREWMIAAPCHSVKAFRRHLRKHPEVNGFFNIHLISINHKYDVVSKARKDTA
jgi:hypothetical protein